VTVTGEKNAVKTQGTRSTCAKSLENAINVHFAVGYNAALWQ